MVAHRVPQVGIVMSDSDDLPRVEPAGRFLRDLDIPFRMIALSAYESPDQVREYSRSATGQGFEVIIAASGGSNALASMVASYAMLPVIALPLRPDADVSASKEFASLLSSLETQAGYPIATVGFNDAENAGCLAAQILGVKDRRVRAKLEAYREESRRAARMKAAGVAAVSEEMQADMVGRPPFTGSSAIYASRARHQVRAVERELDEELALEAELEAEISSPSW